MQKVHETQKTFTVQQQRHSGPCGITFSDLISQSWECKLVYLCKTTGGNSNLDIRIFQIPGPWEPSKQIQGQGQFWEVF